MEVAGYRLRERKKKGPERLLPLFWYQLPDDVLRELWRYTGRQRHRYGLRSGSGSGSGSGSVSEGSGGGSWLQSKM